MVQIIHEVGFSKAAICTVHGFMPSRALSLRPPRCGTIGRCEVRTTASVMIVMTTLSRIRLLVRPRRNAGLSHAVLVLELASQPVIAIIA